MTTIAYRDGVLAADSLMTSNGIRDGNVVKIQRIGPVLVGGAGSAALCCRYFKWVQAGMKGKSPFEGGEDGNGIMIAPGGVILMWGQHGMWKVGKSPFYALGSGEQIALGAMYQGANAVKAVEAAIHLDVYSGGPVRSLRL